MRAVALVAIGFGLSACTGASIVYNSYYSSAYTPSHVDLAAASGPSLAVIRNDPFPDDSENAGVLAAMQGRNFGQKMYFSQTPRPDDKYGYKVVMSFGADSYSYAGQCEVPPAPASPTPPAGEIAVTAAFCVGDRLLTDASGSISGASGPDDPNFRRLIGDMMVALTPPYDPNRRGRDWPD